VSADCFSPVATAGRQYASPDDHRVIDTVDRSHTDAYLEYTLMQRMAVAQVPDSDPVDSGRNSRLYAGRNCKSDFGFLVLASRGDDLG